VLVQWPVAPKSEHSKRWHGRHPQNFFWSYETRRDGAASGEQGSGVSHIARRIGKGPPMLRKVAVELEAKLT